MNEPKMNAKIVFEAEDKSVEVKLDATSVGKTHTGHLYAMAQYVPNVIRDLATGSEPIPNDWVLISAPVAKRLKALLSIINDEEHEVFKKDGEETLKKVAKIVDEADTLAEYLRYAIFPYSLGETEEKKD